MNKLHEFFMPEGDFKNSTVKVHASAVYMGQTVNSFTLQKRSPDSREYKVTFLSNGDLLSVTTEYAREVLNVIKFSENNSDVVVDQYGYDSDNRITTTKSVDELTSMNSNENMHKVPNVVELLQNGFDVLSETHVSSDLLKNKMSLLGSCIANVLKLKKTPVPQA